MNEKLSTMVAEMKKQTIGVEIEMAEITRRAAAKVIAKYFGTEDTVQYEEDGYKSWTCLDRKGRKWKISRDGSIRASRDDMKAELATPILTYEDMDDLQAIVRLLRKAGAISNPAHCCGVHIHIGANGHDARTLRTLANLMASHERLLTKALNLDSYRVSQYCQPVDRDFLQRLNTKKPRTMAELADTWYEGYYGSRSSHYNHSRYHMLNLHATFTKGTIEFRLFQFDNPNGDRKGGLHAGQLKAYIQLCLALSQMAKTARSASTRVLQTENDKFAMRTWLNRLGFIGDEFATAREVFTKRLDGDTAFRFGRAA